MSLSRANWRRLGAIILIIGVSFAGAIFLRARHHEQGAADDDTLNKREIYQAERIGGQADVIAIEMNAWIASWWHGEGLAVTIALGSLGAGSFCFWRSRHAPAA